jgi:bifunctional DNase/RNase
MVLMQLRSLAPCHRHGRVLVVLEDAAGARRLTFYADPGETRRLQQTVERGPAACHPVYDFVRALLGAVSARLLRVVLEDVRGEGIGALVHLRQGATETVVSCYPPDAVALALREQLPIYATDAALDHAVPVAPPSTGPAEVADWLERVRPRDFGG